MACQAWLLGQFKRDSVSVKSKLDRCREALSIWRKICFKSVNKQLRDLQRSLNLYTRN